MDLLYGGSLHGVNEQKRFRGNLAARQTHPLNFPPIDLVTKT